MNASIGAEGESRKDISITDAEDTIEAQAAAQTGQKKVRIRIDESNINTSYVSGFRPTMGPEELMLDFGLNHVRPTGNKEQPVEIVFQASSRLIMSYFSAKRLAVALSRVVRRYEQEFGEIELNAANRRIREPESK
ncbi:MAG: DUF3467 domain-containing protein [Candidatus Hydrogenedentes bacterium]|nr:DUF3467 domain-containing protein [Candidatus Hydrogenedentota bacterium]